MEQADLPTELKKKKHTFHQSFERVTAKRQPVELKEVGGAVANKGYEEKYTGGME